MSNANLLITKLNAGVAAGTSQVDSSILDMSGYEGAVIFSAIATADPANYLKIAQGNQSNLSDGADIAGSKVVAAANGQVVGVEIFQPSDRYLRASIIRGVSTAAGEIYAIQYGGRKKPPNNVITNVMNILQKVSPDEGVA
jgi:hypothetical protein